ncbi:MAG: hypothetical protein ABIJ45_13220 [Candidatus Zixiibacteriota bacterium]
MMFYLFVILIIIFAFANVTFSLMITTQLNRWKIPTSFILTRLYIFKYIGQYRTITKMETGKVGLLFYLWILSINMAAVSAIGAFLTA